MEKPKVNDSGNLQIALIKLYIKQNISEEVLEMALVNLYLIGENCGMHRANEIISKWAR